MDGSITEAWRALPLGLGATVIMDLAGLALARLGIAPLPNYALVGRWVAGMARGQIVHAAIAAAAPARGERALGWAVHYGVGIVFAALLLGLCGSGWLRQPSLAPALAFGLATVAAPFLLMQPAMGAGLAARRTPDPAAARRRSLLNHLLYGLGLYLTAVLLHGLGLAG